VSQARRFASLARFGKPALVNGTPGLVVAPDGRVIAVMGMTARAGRITEINVLADPERIAALDLPNFAT
jgi:RNA polymerase sigma-70 factor (ECF subfamily)